MNSKYELIQLVLNNVQGRRQRLTAMSSHSSRPACTVDDLRSGDGGRWLPRPHGEAFPYYLTRDVWDKIGLVRIKAAPKRAPHNYGNCDILRQPPWHERRSLYEWSPRTCALAPSDMRSDGCVPWRSPWPANLLLRVRCVPSPVRPRHDTLASRERLRCAVA